MSKIPTTTWDYPPRTEVKHKILKAYFGAWISIIVQSQRFSQAIFVDGFCGPGEYDNGEPGSPIIVLDEANAALESPALKNKTQFKLIVWFIDETTKRIEHLKSVLAKYPNKDSRIQINEPLHGTFEAKMPEILAATQNFIPMFVFVDPFGTGFTMALLDSILKRTASEVFLLLDVDGCDRMLGSWEQNKKHLCAIFGTSEGVLNQIRTTANQKQRIQALRNLFLESAGKIAKRSLIFRMYDSKNQSLHDLIFLTNNPLGFVKMKESMWKATTSGDFRFSEAEATDQGYLEFDSPEQRVWHLLMTEFAGKQVSGLAATQYVEQKTRYLNKHKTAALKLHESDQVPVEERIKVTRPKGTKFYADSVLIDFPAKRAS